MNSLLDYLYKLIYDNGFGLEICQLSPDFPSRYIPEYKLIIINSNWHNRKELPFTVGHELGHAINGDDGIMYYSNSARGSLKAEAGANLYSLKLLFNYSKKQGQFFSEPQEFIQAYSIPQDMFEQTKQLFKDDSE